MTKRVYTCFMPFGGGGGGALGVHGAAARLFGEEAEFRVIGGFDNDAYACQVFEYLTGIEQRCVDAWTLTPEMLREIAGEEAPDLILNSAPCIAASQLVSPAKAATAAYVKINSLMGHMTRLVVAAWPKRPPKIILYENVPNVQHRARAVVEDVHTTLVAARYAVHTGTHQARFVGNLAQNRLRWFMACRHIPQVPHFVYRAPKRKGKVCGDVLSPLPLPGDAAGGKMHELPNISFLNYVRLALIPTRGTVRPDGKPAKGDWRDLRVMLEAMVGEEEAVRLALAREKPAQNNVFKVAGWDQPTGAVTSAQSPGNGAVSAADPRVEPAASVVETIGMKVGQGYSNNYAVVSPSAPARTVTGASRPGSGAQSIADGQFTGFGGALGVLDPSDPAATVSGRAGPTTGRFSIADAVIPQADNNGMHYGKYVLLSMGDVAQTITGATRVGSGAQSIADLRTEGFGGGAWGVLAKADIAGTVTANARPSTGSFSVADSSILVQCRNDGNYGVLSPDEAAHTITGKASVGTGPFGLAADRLPLRCAPRAGAYGVIAIRQAIGTITASACLDNGAFAIADVRTPDSPPIVWIEALDKPPRRWEGFTPKGTPKKGKKCAVVILAEDGTWHRPLTTLELAVLQGLPWILRGEPLDFGGGSTAQRKVIGNMIPPPVARAMAEQMLLALIAADTGAFYLDSGGQGVWVDRAEYMKRLRRSGVQVVDEGRGPWQIGDVTVCDDGAVVRARQSRGRRRADQLISAGAKARPTDVNEEERASDHHLFI